MFKESVVKKTHKKFEKYKKTEHKDAFAGKGKTGLIESVVDTAKLVQPCFSSAYSSEKYSLTDSTEKSQISSVLKNKINHIYNESVVKNTLFDTEFKKVKNEMIALFSGYQEPLPQDYQQHLEPIKEALDFEDKEEQPEFENEVMTKLLKDNFGFDSFRIGQMETIKSIFNGQNTMSVLPPGQGKSLIYQFLASIFEGVTIVVTPFVALAYDQLNNMPSTVPAAALTSFTSSRDRKEILEAAKTGKIKVLLCTPEKLMSENLEQLVNCVKIPLLVYDEASSLCKFSRNFRFSYLALKIASEKIIKPRSILLLGSAMTVDEEKYLVEDYKIVKVVKQPASFPTKVKISISKSDDKFQCLLKFLRKSGIYNSGSTIIFCNSKYSIDRVNSYLHSNGFNSLSYHSGKSEEERDRVQYMFRTNKVNILVSTVSFSVGMNKIDLSHLIIFDMPLNIEYLLQQVGRLGRGTIEGKVHVFLNDYDFINQRKKVIADLVSRESIDLFLKHIYCEQNNRKERKSMSDYFIGHKPVREKQLFTLKWEEVESSTEVKKTMQIIIVHELEKMNCLTIEAIAPIFITLRFYKTSPEELAESDQLIKSIFPLCRKYQNGTFRFELAKVVTETKLQPAKIMFELFNLQLLGEISYDASDEGCFLKFSNGPYDVEKLGETIFELVNSNIDTQLKKLNALYLLLRAFASKKFEQFFEDREIIGIRKYKDIESYWAAFRSTFESYFAFADSECEHLIDYEGLNHKQILPLQYLDTARERSSLTVLL